MQKVNIKTNSRVDFVDITKEIREIALSTGVKEGVLTLFVPHTTAAVTINEGADPSVVKDIKFILDKLAPGEDASYEHKEGNSDAHIKASLLGASQQLLISEGELLLGTWQSVFFVELDGPRQRKLYVYLSELKEVQP